ncbi:hypothetical protein JY96_12485 [Aquabacterium sp. NJ1]|uniref:hypothetical protein n=1 Tax=Aquabacterium sp. NJ1 TaxID=1538295 RepID=UPI00052DBCE7|nr:hypothetical protein [Aquabacterium sp. NJ1]KGM40585.1 hypothetical protein JY96_12485 [Aquabacterium sp. NJ1]
MANLYKATAIGLIACLILQACGGGGGGGSTPPDTKVDALNMADGLGNEGHISGTVIVGNEARANDALMAASSVAITLHDDDSGLIAWLVAADAQHSEALTARLSPNGTWQTPSKLQQVSVSPTASTLHLRRNSMGDAVLGWVDTATGNWGRTLRWQHTTQNWDPTPSDFSTGALANGHDHGWDLALNNDLTIMSSATAKNSTPYQTGIWLMDVQGHETFRPTGINAGDTTFARLDPQSDGVFNFYSTSTPTGSNLWVRHESPVAGAQFAGVPLLQNKTICSDYYRISGLHAAASKSVSAVAAVLTDEAGGTCRAPRLNLIRVDALGTFTITPMEANAPQTIFDSEPQVAIDDQGRALAVWCESTRDVYGYPANPQCKWSKSLPGQNWSTPANLVTSQDPPTKYSSYFGPVLAMNAKGQAVTAIKVSSADTTYNPRIMVARFDFDGGWQSWFTAANKFEPLAPAVAINSKGTALLAYSALDVPRQNGRAPNGYGYTANEAPYRRVFAVRF